MAYVPRVGDVVHYVSAGSADSTYPTTCRAAIVTGIEVTTEVYPVSGEPKVDRVGLAVLNDEGIHFRSLNVGGAKRDDGRPSGFDPDPFAPCVTLGHYPMTWHQTPETG